MNPYKWEQEALSMYCPHCNCHLTPTKEVIDSCYSGGPFICGNCHRDVTDAFYGKDKKPKPKSN